MGRGGCQNGLRLVELIIPTVKAGGHRDDEDNIKPLDRQGYADLALNPDGSLGKVIVDRMTPRLEAVLRKTHCTEF